MIIHVCMCMWCICELVVVCICLLIRHVSVHLSGVAALG